VTTETAPIAPAPGLAAERSSSLRRTIAGAARAARQRIDALPDDAGKQQANGGTNAVN